VTRLLAESLPASHVKAGALIRETASAAHTVTVGIGNKAVPDVEGNQGLLLRGLNLFRSRIGSGPILLDGHFALLDSSGAIVKVPVHVYEAIGPVAVLLVEAANDVVHGRLVKRDGAAPSTTTISLLAECERTAAMAVSSQLAIPICVVRGDADAGVPAHTIVEQLRRILAGAA
jgi:adenylate kinase